MTPSTIRSGVWHGDDYALIRNTEVSLDRGRQMPEFPPLSRSATICDKSPQSSCGSRLSPRVETPEVACLGRFCGGPIGQQRQVASSLLLSLALLPLTGEHLEEVCEVKNEEQNPWGLGASERFCPMTT